MLKQGSLLGMALLLLGFVTAGCEPFKREHGGSREEGGVQLRLAEGDMKQLRLAGENPTKLRIRIFAVVDDQQGDQEGNDNVFDLLEDSATYKITKVKLGYKEFEVTILNDQAEPVGVGSARHLVRPGLQQMDPISIKIVPPQGRRRNVEVNLWVNVQVPGEAPKTTWLDVKRTITSCASTCHTDTSADGSPLEPKGGLILKDFPFVSVIHPDWPQDYIVDEMLYWMKDPTDPMPPRSAGQRVPDEEIALIAKWLDDGLPKFPAADQTSDLAKKIKLKWTLQDGGESLEFEIPRSNDPEHPFRLTCNDLIIKGSYDLTFEVYGIDGSLTYKTTVSDYILAEGGAFEHVLTIPYEEPAIDIPVVVTR